MLIDTHAHLNFSAYDSDRKEIIKQCQKKGMVVINVGSQTETSKLAVEIAQKHKGMYAAVGIHPIHIGKTLKDPNELANYGWLNKPLPELFDEIKNLVALHCYRRSSNVIPAKAGIQKTTKGKKIVAIGESGLDFFYLKEGEDKIKELQKEYFLKHLNLAKGFSLPVILHCRGSKVNPDDVYLEMLKTLAEFNLPGVIHCFGSTLEIAQQFIKLGFYIGFTGIITFGKKSENLQAVVKAIPIEKILTETDCPFLAPAPHRGQRNLPFYTELVNKKVAELKNLSYNRIESQLAENANKLFNF